MSSTRRSLGAALPRLTVDAPDLENVSTMTEATAAFLDALGLQRVHILGASLGGYLAQAFAVAHPERVDQLLISNGFYDPRDRVILGNVGQYGRLEIETRPIDPLAADSDRRPVLASKFDLAKKILERSGFTRAGSAAATSSRLRRFRCRKTRCNSAEPGNAGVPRK
jgi:pimeloyl-ACP methyl ester carboxylesterase